MIGIARATLLLLLACLTWIGPLAAETPALTDVAPASGSPIESVAASHGMVVAQEGRAARIGVEVLEQGGNAIDAAVATGFALAVTSASSKPGTSPTRRRISPRAGSIRQSTIARPRRLRRHAQSSLMSEAKPTRTSPRTPRLPLAFRGPSPDLRSRMRNMARENSRSRS